MRSQRILAGLCVVAGAAWAQSAGALPEGKGKAEFERVCGQCHGVQLIVKANHTADAWGAVVDEMIGRGAQGTDDDFERVVQYLTAHFGPKVNVNKADSKELEKALEVTAAEAEAIVRYRETAGTYKEWRDLEKVQGLDLKKLEQKKHRLVFAATPDSSANKK